MMLRLKRAVVAAVVCVSLMLVFTGSAIAVPIGVVSSGFVSGQIAPDATGLQSIPFPVTQAVPAGSFVSLVIAKGFGDSVTYMSNVTDTEGNRYTIDANNTYAGGFGNDGIAVASATLTHALTTSDSLTVAWSGGWGSNTHIWVYGSAFSGAIGLDVAGTPIDGWVWCCQRVGDA
jgi:hypothetical protein